MDFIENIVIGAGALGIATAKKFQENNKSCLIIEKKEAIFNETSSRNSEVIHSGIYYQEGSYKNKFCLRGKELLYSYLKNNDIEYKKCGKLIVSNGSNEQNKKIEDLKNLAKKKSIKYKVLEPSKIEKKYYFLKSNINLFIEDTGIFDSHSFGLSLLKDFENYGGLISFKTEIHSIEKKNNTFQIKFMNSNYKISCNNIILCSGLDTIDILNRCNLVPYVPEQVLCKGDYFSYNGKIRSDCLIYPIPNELGLGIHLTCGLDGKLKFGPDTKIVDSIDYKVLNDKKGDFLRSIKEYIPEIKEDDLQPDYSGIRPKIRVNGEIYKDFYPIIEDKDSLKICTILSYESPGLTSCLAAADFLYGKVYGG